MMMIVALFTVLSTVNLAKRCPAPLDIQDPSLAETFSMEQFLADGLPYYELALHDYTQPSICGCMRSVKTWSVEKTYIHDNFTMVCPWNKKRPNYGALQISDLSFNITDEPGVLHGNWPVTQDLVFPDTVSAVGQSDTVGAPYRWALEVQCVEENESIIFVGINFYARDRVGDQAERSYQEMLTASYELGIDQLWGGDISGLRRIDQDLCFYDNNPTEEAEFLQ